MKSKIEIIAEIGVNHNGDLSKAIKLVQLAKKCGADAVKFQTFFADEICKTNAKKAIYQSKTTPKNLSHYEMLKSLEFEKEEFYKIFKFCKKLKIKFISTPYDVKSVNLLKKLNIDAYKVASTDLVDTILHKEIIKTKKPVIISTGASKLNEIKKTILLYKRQKNKNISLLHCVSNYPCSKKSLNLNVITTLKRTFNLPVGFSDHYNGNKAAELAVALGAKLIEKHFTLDKKMSGPDHISSLNPYEFREYVKSIRDTEIYLGSNIKQVQPEEKSIRKISRKSITLKKNMKKNSKISLKDIQMKRPGTGIIGQQLDLVLGKKLKFNLKKDHQIKKKDLY